MLISGRVNAPGDPKHNISSEIATNPDGSVQIGNAPGATFAVVQGQNNGYGADEVQPFYVQRSLFGQGNAPGLSKDFGTVTKARASSAEARVFALAVTNGNAAKRWFQLHNKGTAAPVATDVPDYSFLILPGASVVIGVDFFVGGGADFSIGLGWAWSTAAGTFVDTATASDHTTHVHFT